MAIISDENLEPVLDDPGAYFDRPGEVANATLSPNNKLRVLTAWRRWLLSDDKQAPNTDEDQKRRDLQEIGITSAAIENSNYKRA